MPNGSAGEPLNHSSRARSELAQVVLEVVVALDLDDSFRFSGEELVDRLRAAGPGRILVLVEEHDAPVNHSRKEELETLPIRLVDHAVEVHEAESRIGVARQRVLKVPR